MSQLKTQQPRSLGSVRSTTSSSQVKLSDSTKLFPNNSSEKKICEGIFGSSVTVTNIRFVKNSPPRVSFNDRIKTDGNTNQISKVFSGNVISHENCKKKIQEGLSREKELKNQIKLLSKELEELKEVLQKKDEANNVLMEQLEIQETRYAAYLNEERLNHENTKVILSETKTQIMETNKKIEKLIEKHDEELEEQKEESEKLLKKTIAEKDAVIVDRDQKISRLKSQMADTLKGNSWERQQQLDELTQELYREQEASDVLRMKIKSLCKNKQNQHGKSSSCEESSVTISKLQAALEEREVVIKELKAVCCKFESQLCTQDNLLEQWALSKGYKIIAPK